MILIVKPKEKEYFRIKNTLKKYTDNERLKVESKKYKAFIRNVSRRYYKNLHADIRNMKSKDPKQYWNLMSVKNSNQKTNNISMQTLFNHFKSLGDTSESGNGFDPRNCEIPENTLINKPFTKEEVLD